MPSNQKRENKEKGRQKVDQKRDKDSGEVMWPPLSLPSRPVLYDHNHACPTVQVPPALCRQDTVHRSPLAAPRSPYLSHSLLPTPLSQLCHVLNDKLTDCKHAASSLSLSLSLHPSLSLSTPLFSRVFFKQCPSCTSGSGGRRTSLAWWLSCNLHHYWGSSHFYCLVNFSSEIFRPYGSICVIDRKRVV